MSERLPDHRVPHVICRELRLLREAHGLHQRDVAEGLGYKHRSMVMAWETGRHDPRLAHASDWAAYFDARLVLVADDTTPTWDMKTVATEYLENMKALINAELQARK